MTSPLLQAAARAWLDDDDARARVRDPQVTFAALRYILDTKETR